MQAPWGCPLKFVRPTLRTPFTIPVHDQCNKSYQADEDYFVTALMPHARGSCAGDAIYKRALDRYLGGGKVGLVRKVLAEFEPRPSGLVLPRNQVVQRFDGTRISRVAWKIVRGLHFHHTTTIACQRT